MLRVSTFGTTIVHDRSNYGGKEISNKNATFSPLLCITIPMFPWRLEPFQSDSSMARELSLRTLIYNRRIGSP